jgi:putative PEP-CTERM system histidine kinase
LDELIEKRPAFIVPLLHDSLLTGFVVISEPSAVAVLNYEDRDLLKTAGQQIASYLAQELYTERLAEGRQFEAFSRLTAYLMHDLKNLVAQQSLIVENAERHRSNPDFVDDALNTVAAGVVRMRKVLEHLHQAPLDQPVQRVELGNIVTQAVSQCGDRKPNPTADYADKQLRVKVDRDRLTMALNHAIRNAQDATEADGTVTISLEHEDGIARITVSDTGTGMEEAFIRERLFKPFDSTKGTQGMGIGAYQIRETIRTAGGDVRVFSTPGQGTKLIIELKIVDYDLPRRTWWHLLNLPALNSAR